MNKKMVGFGFTTCFLHRFIFFFFPVRVPMKRNVQIF